MPTLVWIRRSESGPDADDATSRRRGEDAAVPDPVVSAASAAADTAPDVAAAAAAVMPPAHGLPPPTYGVPPTFATGPYHHHHHHHQQHQRQRQQPPLLRRHATADDGTTTTSSKHDGRRKKRKMYRSGQATAAKKKSKELGLGVYKTLSGKFQARIHFGSKYRHLGTFDTPEQASAAFMSVRKDLGDAKLPPHESENSGSAIFDEAKKQALESFGGFEREFPRGVGRASSGRFRCSIQWGGKSRYIGTFDTPEQASAVFMSVRKALDDANLSAFGADEGNVIFNAAREKARESIKGNV